MMTVVEARDNALVTAFGIVRVEGGYSFVRLKTCGDKVVEKIFAEPDSIAICFDHSFKKAAGAAFVHNSPPEARWPKEQGQ